MTTVKVKYWGVPLELGGIYTPGDPEIPYTENLDGYPGSPAEFEVYRVLAGEVDILPILNWDQTTQIEQLALEKL